MSTLQENLDAIKLDKDTNLKPENLKAGVNCLGVTGILEALSSLGVKIFDTVELMEADVNATENDIAMVFDRNNKQFKGMYQYKLNYIDENKVNSITDMNLTISKDESNSYTCTYNKNIEVDIKFNKAMLLKAVAYFIKNIKTLEELQEEDEITYNNQFITITIIDNIPYISYSKSVTTETKWKIEEDGSEVEYTCNYYKIYPLSSVVTQDLKLDTNHLYTNGSDVVLYKINPDGTISDRNEYTADSNHIVQIENITSYNLCVMRTNLEELRIYSIILITKINSETEEINYITSARISGYLINISNISCYMTKGYKCLYLPSNEIINMSTLSSDEVLESRLFTDEGGNVKTGSLPYYENETQLTANAALTCNPRPTTIAIGTTVADTGIIKQGDHIYNVIKQSELANYLELTATKLMKGNTILRISGTATSDADAVAADIVSGKTAYVKGKKITGTYEPMILNNDGIILQEFDDCPITITLEGSTSTVALKINTTKDTGTIANTPIGVIVNYSTLAEAIGLTADKIKAGETILGITGN